MSLSTFLLGGSTTKKDKGKAIDKGLDDLFKTAAAAPEPPKSKAGPKAEGTNLKNEKKRKVAALEVEGKQSKKAKRAQPEVAPTPIQIPSNKQPGSSTKAKQPHKKAKAPVKPAPSEGSPDDDEGDAPVPASSSSVESDEDGEVDPTKLIHESVTNGGKPKSTHGKTKHVPSEETPEQRDARTIFVGNVPVEVVKSRPLQKQLNKHILSLVPSAKIESVRFRSVAFNKPTTELPSTDPSSSKDKDGRKHDRERAATWRAAHGEDDATTGDTTKKFLTPQEKKRIAFIKQEIHGSVDSVNAYVVFAHPPPTENWPKNLPPPKAVMDPYEAAKAAVRDVDGSVFLERTVRVDLALKGGKKAATAEDAREMVGDPKATVFVGNLDFACKEEDVRAFFEALVVAERGEPGARVEGEASEEEDDEDEDEDAEGADEAKEKPDAKPRAWVKRVRIIRDKDTLLGKGFGYVQFTDRECVDEVLALEVDRLKFAKRKLRVQRCKTLPGAPKVPKKAATKSAPANAAQSRSHARPSSVPVPKGDPNLGTKLEGLSKEERKQIKSTDADRVARRLAKKQAKALAEKGVKAKASDKDRVRKRLKDKKGGAAAAGSKGKKRVRSGKALAKMNTKK